MRYYVMVENDKIRDFETPREAVEYARSRLYMPEARAADAVNALVRGRAFSYVYGFVGADIVPHSEDL